MNNFKAEANELLASLSPPQTAPEDVNLEVVNQQQQQLETVTLHSGDKTAEVAIQLPIDVTSEEVVTSVVAAPSPVLPSVAVAAAAAVPVKKREKPRIIENVTLKGPMQILKTKLMEKSPVTGN